MRAAIYARVSSAQQRDAQSIESQLRTLPAFIAARGWNLVATYKDDGRSAQSGKLAARTGLAAMLAAAAARAFDVVVVADMDRLTRAEDLAERGAILGALQRAGVQLAVASSGQVLDLNSSMGDMYSALQGVWAAEWVRKHREKVLRGRELGVSRGRKPPGAIAYGLAWDGNDWSIDEPRAAVVREIFERVAAGESGRQVGLDLERRGIPTTRGGRWNIGRLVHAETYRGVLVTDRARGQRIAVPRIVDDVLWHAAQAALSREALRGKPRTRRFALCQGIARCALCGSHVGVHSILKRGPSAHRYLCWRRKHPPVDQPPCQLPMFRVSAIDAAVWEAVEGLIQRPDLVDLLAGRVAGADEAATWSGDREEWQAQLAQLAAAEGAILDRFARGLISEQAMDAHLGRSAARRGLLERQVAQAGRAGAEARRTQASAAQAAAVAAELRARAHDAPPDLRRDLVRALVPGWGPHVVTLGADGTVTVGALLRREVGSLPDARYRPHQDEPDNSRIAVTLRVVSRR